MNELLISYQNTIAQNIVNKGIFNKSTINKNNDANTKQTNLESEFTLKSIDKHYENMEIKVEVSNDNLPKFVNYLVHSNCEILSVSPIKSLEDYFLKLTGAN